MSTQHEMERKQETPVESSPSLSDEQNLPAQPPPQPPPHPPYPHTRRWTVIGTVILVLALILSLGVIFLPGLIQRPTGQVKPTPKAPGATSTPVPTAALTQTPRTDLTPTPEPGVIYGPRACPAGIGASAHWDAIIGTNQGENFVESVICANILGNPSLQALVKVRHTNAGSTLDVYVFNDISSSRPTRIFLLQNLVQGDARISGYNTVLTAEVDPHSSLNIGKPTAAWTKDLFREFEWNADKGVLVQVAFPGIFPDLTRYQAEADQAGVKQGKDSWKNDPRQVAQKLGEQFFSWKRPLTATLISGGGANDVWATVKVEGTPFPGMKAGPSVNVMLSRLEGNTHNMWVDTAVEDGSGVLTSIQARSLIASPVRLEGKGNAFEGDIGNAYILDHLYTIVGQAHLSAAPGLENAASPYSVRVTYDTSFKDGPQEGVVEIALMSPVGAPYVMVKVLLNPQQNVALGPLSCPVAVQAAGYWESHFGISPSSVTCGNLKGPAYSDLLALVMVSPTESAPGHLYVYDLTHAPPVQVFDLQTNRAKISSQSTIITDDLDTMKTDVYREYAWSGNGFVQVAFSGMYPALTRWQAEDAQAMVAKGQNTWMLDAVKTVQHLFLFSGPNIKLVSGGGAHDLDAVVQVSIPSSDQSGATERVTLVTLSRLDRNPNGIWEVTAVGSDWLSLSAPRKGTTIHSPVTVTGFGPQVNGKIAQVFILDHLYQPIQNGDIFALAPDSSSPPSTFSLEVPYTSSFQQGAQEGIIELFHSGDSPSDYGLAMVKVLIGP
jgi:hypothetical protein